MQITDYALITLVPRASDVNVILRPSRLHESSFPAKIYIKTSYPHDCQCI